MRSVLIISFSIFLVFGLHPQKAFAKHADPPVIPLPAKFALREGCFDLEKPVGLLTQGTIDSSVVSLAQRTFEAAGRKSFPSDGRILAGNSLMLKQMPAYDSLLGREGYALEINSTLIVLTANHQAGFRYGLNTLYQLLKSAEGACLPLWEITDFPRFGYRGMHLDVSRHFMPVEFIYRYIDILALHRMNVFHWHLVDDQGWRLQIERYPLLTEVGAWREERPDQHWNLRGPSRADAPKNYGGYYTKEQVRQVVAYAAARNITVVPEIEMPAHVMSALAAYPELSCTGQNLGVPPGGVWPITHIYCAGKEETFEFLENVLLEVMDLFPSPFIHIGGDEADKTEWQRCPLCQKRMKQENLPDVHALQSYFIKRIGRFLESHGRRLMGWDEILEGGLAENAIVMSWRGEEGGIQAARMGHQVVMTPGSHCYFDHYQGDPATEPLAIGGFTPLDKVYSYEPVPTALSSDEAKYVLGAQANVWTEYMPVPKHVEYMVLPRMAALSEVLWSPKTSRDWNGFIARLPFMINTYNAHGFNYAQSAWKVQLDEEADFSKKQIMVRLRSLLPVDSIVYHLELPSGDKRVGNYKDLIVIQQTSTLAATSYLNGEAMPAVKKQYRFHKAFGLSVDQNPKPSEQYPGGPVSLTNGILGTTWHGNKHWTGILNNHWEATITFPKRQKISNICLVALHDPPSWIFLPDSLVVFASADGMHFNEVARLREPYPWPVMIAQTKDFCLSFRKGSYKAIRIEALHASPIPEEHPGSGKKVWMFLSEIIVE